MGIKIHEYANEAFQINDEDFYDVDYWNGASYESRKISGATLKSELSGGSGGRFGIADTNGVYTYYTTLTAAMTAAVSGQTIEVFADYTETSAVTIRIKNGVTINGNGHTYTLTTNSGIAFDIANSISTVASILDLNVVCSGTSSICLYLATNTSGTLTLTGSIFRNTSNGTCLSNFANSDVEVLDFKGFSNTGRCVQWASSSNGRLRNSYCYSASEIGYLGSVRVDNCICISGTNIGLYSQGGTVSDSIGISSGSYGIQTTSGVLNNCKGYSSAQAGIYALYSNLYGCFGYSTASFGIQFDNEPCRGYNCFGFSTANTGIRMYRFGSGSDMEIYNSTALSTASAAFFFEGYATNMTCISEYNNASGHAAQGANNATITNSSLVVKNASANCLYSASAVTQKYAQCTFKGATTPVNANITQGMVNTEDAQGNITI
jgi:hypothetical protein